MCYERPKLKVIVVCLRFLAGIKDGERAVSLLLVISIENPNGVSFAPAEAIAVNGLAATAAAVVL